MRLASFIAPAIAGILVLCVASDAAAQSGGSRRSGWYVGGGVGANWASDINQTGFNRDPLCYPTDACFDEDPRPEVSGYRWGYDLDAAAGAMFELSTGFILSRARLEVSFGQRKNDLDQMFRSVTTLEGIAMEDRRNTTVTSHTESSIDDLTVRTLAFNGYYDFRDAATGFSPYVGAGVGPAFVDIRGVRFTDEYMDTAGNGAAHDPPLSSYNARLDTDFSATVLAGHLHGGDRLRPERPDVAGREADVFDVGRRRVHRRIRPSFGERPGPELHPHRHVHRDALLDVALHRQARVRRLIRSDAESPGNLHKAAGENPPA